MDEKQDVGVCGPHSSCWWPAAGWGVYHNKINFPKGTNRNLTKILNNKVQSVQCSIARCLSVCLWKDWGKSRNFDLLGRKSSTDSPEYKLAFLVTEQWSSMISVSPRLCVQIFCLKIYSSSVRRLWGHQFYEFSSYSNIQATAGRVGRSEFWYVQTQCLTFDPRLRNSATCE